MLERVPCTSATSSASRWVAAAQKELARDDAAAAIGYLERAIVSDPADAQAYAWLGRAYQSQGKLSPARKYYDIALTIDPLQPSALNWTGQLALVSRDYETAERNLARLERSCPDCPETRELAALDAELRPHADQTDARKGPQ